MSGGWTGVLALLAVLLVLVVVGWALYARALRVDRLHRQVLGARATLETQLVHRAQAAAELAASGGLDAASALLLSRAAHDALEAEGPLVDDGLAPASDERVGAAGTGTRALPGSTGTPAQVRGRAAIESDLSRVVRAVLDEEARAELTGQPAVAEALTRLDRAGYRVVLARRFHDTHVAEARSLRSSWPVRSLRLAGRAPLPATFDMDDDLAPDAAPPDAQEEQP